MTRPPPLPRRHAPKLRALEALDAGALSPEGERRLRAHLATCARCQQAQASMHLYGALTGELRAEDALRRRPVDFARVELPLRREARQQAARARRARSLRRAAPLAVAAAVGLVALATAKVADDPGQGALVAERQPVEVREALPAAAAAPRTAPEATAPARPSAVAHVTAVAGIGPELQRTGQAPTAPGGVLREGDRLVAPVDTEVHVALLPGSSMTLVGPGALLVRRLRGAAPERAAEVLLELEHGRLRSQVAPGTDYAVSSAPYTVRVRGTRFEVARAEGDAANTPLGTRVDVAEGVVEVAGEGELRRLTAPARWSSPEMTVDAPASGDVPSPYDPGALTDVALLRLPAMEGVARWQVAGAGVSGRRLALLLPVGERRRVEGFDAAGELVARTLVTLGPEGRSLEERHMSWPQEPREGVLRPEQIRPVVARAQRRLRSCYERELRRNPTLGSQGYQLRVRVTPQGRVAQASAAGPASAPSSLRGCLEREARSWSFPEPEGGGPVVFELPVNLAPRR